MKAFTFALLLCVAVASSRRYDGYQVFQVKPQEEASFGALINLWKEQSSFFDFWTEPRGLGHPTDVMVPPTFVKPFESFLQSHKIEYRVKIADVQAAIEHSNKDRAAASPRGSRSSRYALTWDKYYSYPAIAQFLYEVATNNPDKVSLKTIGKSFENREMLMVKISTGSDGNTTKNAIVVEAGIHAREWISPAFATWLIHELVENYTAHPQYVDNVDWYILPAMNPDGYIYSFNDDRLWRKNRRPNNGRCIGVDLNRNFGFHWNEGGTTANGCDETYHGESPFSEDESQHVRDGVLSVAANSKAYFAMHSYGQYWLTPWGYTSDLPEDYDLLYDLASQAVGNLTAVYGTEYSIGSSTNLLYVASGGSDDWAKGGAGIQYAYTVEARDTGDYGFLLPADQIIPNNLEMWEAFKVVADAVAEM